MSLEDDLMAIIVEQLGVDPKEVNENSSFIEDLNADSLDLTELIMTLEEKFAFEISEADAEQLRTVGDVLTYIRRRQAEQ
ncbi:acyl carrier protein [Candidatus Chlamydia sanziniae]|uniref:Acyl carrier protein n=1 Tax=Candidatus Chlamydia sanziniae TaxID=1806891 RepID=A0A1A9HWG6_9CHLA|nr:acyl carrier protein [Candidatus Chlamydia sanziniae]ANH79037.1 Acyl carrier protein [Candidatus Chlamydia sanziniae]